DPPLPVVMGGIPLPAAPVTVPFPAMPWGLPVGSMPPMAPLQAAVPSTTARVPASSQPSGETGFLLSCPAFIVTPREALVEARRRLRYTPGSGSGAVVETGVVF